VLITRNSFFPSASALGWLNVASPMPGILKESTFIVKYEMVKWLGNKPV
jgi:hypothetical protein